MANHKRKRARVNQSSKCYYKWGWQRKGLNKVDHEYSWLSNWPKWWDIVYHTRPSRRRTAVLISKVMSGYVDPDDTTWPNYRKPHQYYW